MPNPLTPGPVKISHKKDGRRRRSHRFNVSLPSPLTYPAAGSATAATGTITLEWFLCLCEDVIESYSWMGDSVKFI